MSFTSDVAHQLHILGHDGDTFCMNGAQVGILIQANKVSLGCFLLCQNCCTFELQVISVLLHDFVNQVLERALLMRRSVDFWYL
jgi:hypothetical protein